MNFYEDKFGLEEIDSGVDWRTTLESSFGMPQASVRPQDPSLWGEDALGLRHWPECP